MWTLNNKHTVEIFIRSLNLNEKDQHRLVDHILERSCAGLGPKLDDLCDEHFRQNLQSNLPPLGLDGMSWQGMTKLKNSLDKGFTQKQAHKIGIPAIGIVAVLVANVAFVAWVQVPGGPNPTWQGCNYPLFTGFLIVNGIAFMLAVASATVVTAFPLVLSRTPQQTTWWGGVLLMLSMLAFILAFLLAGFVTVGYQSPPASCSSLRCDQGGIRCQTGLASVSQLSPDYAGDPGSTIFVTDPVLAVLNGVISNISSAALCVTYNRSVSHGNGVSTLYPWAPPTTYAQVVPSQESTDALTKLLTDPMTQKQTVCMEVSDFPAAIDPTMTLDNLAVNVSHNIPNLTEYLIRTNLIVWDLLPRKHLARLVFWTGLPYYCLSHTTKESMRFDVLCDSAWETLSGNFSVSKSGQHIKSFTVSDSGAVLFDVDSTAAQVSTAIQALAGVFGCICIVIVVFLIRTKGV